ALSDACSAGADDYVLCASGGFVAFGVERQVSRRALCASVPDSDLDVCFAHHLSVERSPSRMEMADVAQSDHRSCRIVSLGAVRSRFSRFAAGVFVSCDCRIACLLVLYVQADGTGLRRSHLPGARNETRAAQTARCWSASARSGWTDVDESDHQSRKSHEAVSHKSRRCAFGSLPDAA